jgi:epsilon-lactone hydrolase
MTVLCLLSGRRKPESRSDVFPGMVHSFQMMAGRAPEADDAIVHFAEWVRTKLGLAGF